MPVPHVVKTAWAHFQGVHEGNTSYNFHSTSREDQGDCSDLYSPSLGLLVQIQIFLFFFVVIEDSLAS